MLNISNILISMLKDYKYYFFLLYKQISLYTPNIALLAPRLSYRRLSNEFIIIISIWLVEWILIIEILLGEWHRAYIFFPIRIPLLLIICFGCWLFLWSIAVWRRTQYGKFTRGERKLWAKAITSFWVAELVTLTSFIIIYMWMSWGPAPLVPRIFMVSRKGIIIELIIYSYMLFLALMAKLMLKWQLWRTQLILCSLVLIIFSYLLWKDVVLLLTRENLYASSSARWRNLRSSAIVYTLSHDWWVHHLTTIRTAYTPFNHIDILLEDPTTLTFSTLPTLLQYEQNLIVHLTPHDTHATQIFPILQYIINYTARYQQLQDTALQHIFYPRRTGFIPKRLSMWQLLIILKMWHHLIIILWWTLFIFKLNTRRQTSYTILSVCTFNIYCCLLLALIVYAVYMINTWTQLMRFRPGVFNIHRWTLWTHKALLFDYYLLFTKGSSTCTPIPPVTI